MKKILIVGDSLTAGHPGASFVDVLARAQSSYLVIADGRGGDTLLGISRRLPSLLKWHVPDIVIIEAGANDLLLPWFRSRGGSWKQLADRLDTSGSPPTESVLFFHSLYAETAATVRQYTPAAVMATIPCLGEDLTSRLNRQREKYNHTIRLLAEKCQVHLADVGRAFDDILRTVPRASAYLLDEYYCLYLDTLLTATNTATDFLSRHRGLTLTVDGVHLNRRGAQVFAETIREKLKAISR